jgi:hypothetical protein
MPSLDPNHEFHDELLSAYLDGELSAEERARVEERLAVDPVARQTLEELRDVSQAVRRLPKLSLNEDLRPAILSHVAASAPSAGAASAGAALPSITVGRSRRGWFWAALATAAAILIMVYAGDRGRMDEPIDVAARGRARETELEELVAQNPDRKAESNSDQAALIARDAAGPGSAQQQQPGAFQRETLTARLPAGADDMSREFGVELGLQDHVRPADSLPLALSLGDRGQAAAEAGEAESSDRYSALSQSGARPAERFDIDAGAANLPSTSSTPLAENRGRAVAEEALGRGMAAGVATTPEPPAGAPSSNVATNDVLVCYVDMTREAIRSGVFEQQLARQQITLDPTSGERMENVNRLTSNFSILTNDYYSYYKRDQTNVEPVDAILVEASPAQLASLFTQLNRDAENVVRIAVDDKQLADQNVDASKLAGIDWSWFDRGSPSEEPRSGQRLATSNRSFGFSGGGESFNEQEAAEPVRAGGGRGGRGGRRGRARGANRGGAAPTQMPAGDLSAESSDRSGGRATVGRELSEQLREQSSQSNISGRARRVRWSAVAAAPESSAATFEQRGAQTSASDAQSRRSAGTSERSSAEFGDRYGAWSGSVDAPPAAEPARTPSQDEPLRVLFVLSVPAESGTPTVAKPVESQPSGGATSPPPADREK